MIRLDHLFMKALEERLIEKLNEGRDPEDVCLWEDTADEWGEGIAVELIDKVVRDLVK